MTEPKYWGLVARQVPTYLRRRAWKLVFHYPMCNAWLLNYGSTKNATTNSSCKILRKTCVKWRNTNTENKYWKQIKYMLAGMFNKLFLLNSLNRGLWEEEFEVLLVSLLFGLNATCFAPNWVRTHRVCAPELSVMTSLWPSKDLRTRNKHVLCDFVSLYPQCCLVCSVRER